MNFKKFFLGLLPILVLVMIVVGFYWKYFFKGLVPFPGDLLVGAYYPWLDYKWGNVVGVAVKNTFISDIFSYFFVEKVEIVNAILNKQWPVWSTTIYSGFPLFSNYNTGALNPFNLLMIVWGKIDGWSLLVISQMMFSLLSMYIYLKTIKKNSVAAILGSIVYAVGGFSITWSQYVNAGFVMVWIPLILTCIEKYKESSNSLYLALLSPLLFLVVTAGHFQGLVYTAILTVCYFVFRLGVQHKKGIVLLVAFCLVAIGLGSMQILPTIELMTRSIRFDDGMIAGNNYGLLPAQNLITLLAPDYFGNPTTGNFWGFYNYHETIIYGGVFGLLSLCFGLTYFRKLGVEKFFVVLAALSLLLIFDTPLGRAIYTFKVPFLYTCAAGRIGMILLLSVSIIAAAFFERIGKMSVKEIGKVLFVPTAIAAISGGISVVVWYIFSHSPHSSLLTLQTTNLMVGIRNMVIPTTLLFAFGFVLLASSKFKWMKYGILFIVVADLFRFGWKYLPFVPEKYIFPNTEVTDFIKQDKGVFRVEKEQGEVMPPNTWMGYDLMSPSGFDPLAITNYVRAYREDLNGYTEGGVGRYSELDRVEAEPLGRYNVKYLLAIKRNEKYEIPGDRLSYKINQKDWSKVFETKSVAVLQNKKYRERAILVDSNGNMAKGSVEIVSYQNNKVVVRFNNSNGAKLLLADTYYPGWEATINGRKTKIGNEIRPFRTVDIRGISDGEVVFWYKPKSYQIGLNVSIASAIVWLLLVFYLRKSKG